MDKSSAELKKIFTYALNQERTGLAFFTASLARMTSASAQSAFRMLIGEEERHVTFLQNLLEGLDGTGGLSQEVVRSITIQPSNFFDARAKSEFLEECLQGSMVPDVTVFNTAWLIEKDLAEFYAQMAGRTTDREAKAALQTLSGWEKKHEVFFREFRDKLDKEYGRMAWGG